MQLLLLIVALMTVAGLVVLIASLRKAPMGYEDEQGFHATASTDDDADTTHRGHATDEGDEHLDDTATHAA